ncbi:OmpH family outer membrane protein [Fuchsiella alkaliacetigena]|uniref:OmpH family outer membrane protein n=1 Tax=Fuchsiella alkaliacetigena TaxID=957042 RepID=UPI00200B6D13|nr:OmpH family outer membrane protein [Fuchsiella alkaliacetigena]MCK8825300.1 OmpH family outer membrane protein [Fuchsiella alkaliacetigena]
MLKMNKRKAVLSLLIVFLLISSFSLSVRAAESTKIVYVNIESVFEAHPATQEAREKLQLEVQKMREELGDLDPGESQMMQQQFEQELQELQNQLMEEAFAELRADIQQIADEKGYDYIVGDNMLLAGGEDVTEEILAELQ